MSKIPTAKEYLKQLDEESGTVWTEDDDDICKAFIHFAQLHVEAALKAAADNADFTVETYYSLQEGSSLEIDRDSILSAYPKENIK